MPRPSLPVVALVASAGGLEAVSRVLAALPPALPAALVVLIHQEPGRVGQLVELFERRSALPVAAAEDDGALAAGRVVVAPAGWHTLVVPGPRTRLVASGVAPPSRPSADLLLTTLAVAVGERAIAVVLSGGGHDGATGASAVHDFGGTVVATDEATSEVWSMPEATISREDAIGHVVALDEVAPLLARLLRE